VDSWREERIARSLSAGDCDVTSAATSKRGAVEGALKLVELLRGSHREEGPLQRGAESSYGGSNLRSERSGARVPDADERGARGACAVSLSAPGNSPE